MSIAKNHDAGNLSDDESNSSDTSSGHTSDDDGNDDGHPMMSIFASYYGIEDPSASAPESKPKGTIDDAGFQAEQYVKVRPIHVYWYCVFSLSRTVSTMNNFSFIHTDYGCVRTC